MLKRILPTEARELLAPQTGDYLPAALDDGIWYGNESRLTLGVILPDDNWRFVLFTRDESFRYQRVGDGTGYENIEGAERSMRNRAATMTSHPHSSRPRE